MRSIKFEHFLLPLLLLLPSPLDKGDDVVHRLQTHAVLRAGQDHPGLQNQMKLHMVGSDKITLTPDLLHPPPLLRACRCQCRGCPAPPGRPQTSPSILLPTLHIEPKAIPEAQSLPLEFDPEPWWRLGGLHIQPDLSISGVE